MSLSDITNKIESDASEKAEFILKEANTAKQAILSEVEKKKAELIKKYEVSTAERMSRNEKRIKESALREGKQYVESQKRSQIDSVFASAYESLISMSSDEYVKIISSFLNELSGEMGKVKVFAPSQRENETKEALKAAKIDAEIGADKNIEGGLLLEGNDFEYDFSFKKLMEQQRDELEVKVAKTLFS